MAKSEFRPSKIIGRVNRIWRQHFPGEIINLPLAPRDEHGNFFKEKHAKTGQERDKTMLGDDLLESSKKYHTFSAFTAEQAVGHYLGPNAAKEYFSNEEISIAVEEILEGDDTALKTKLEGFIKGEAQRAMYGLVEVPKVQLAPQSMVPTLPQMPTK